MGKNKPREGHVIPKTIHYCWFGGGPHTELMRKCLASWGRLLPDYQIRCWDEQTSPMDSDYLKRAWQHRKWANMSNFVRLHALLTVGGIYLDTDVEVVKSFDDLLCLPAFLGCESRVPKVNNAVYGSEAGHPFLWKARSQLITDFDGTERANESSPNLMTRLLLQSGLGGYQESPQLVADIVVFPTRFFYPFHFKENFTDECITSDTYCVHYWQKTWG
jgi:mannosyltransferase OCH1-like enzyme